MLEGPKGASAYQDSCNLNEGFTELYAIRGMEKMGFDYHSTSYITEVEVARRLEEVIGRDVIQEAYFLNKPDRVRAEFENALADPEELKELGAGESVHSGLYREFLNDLDDYVRTNRNYPDYTVKRDKLFGWFDRIKMQGGKVG